MKDRIIEAYLKGFSDEFRLGDVDESKAFEHFVNYYVVSRLHPDTFDPEDVSVGGGGDLGLDGVAILVNDHLVQSCEAVDYFKKDLRRLDVDFVFVQAKTSPHFDAAGIGNFISGVRQFFSDTLPENTNASLGALYAVKEHIFDASIDMDRSPGCRLYYATLGNWQAETDLRKRIDQGITDLTDTGLFSSVVIVPIDAEALKGLHREIHHRITREVLFEKHAILPPIAGVVEAYIGILPCTEYLKLICDEEGALNRRLFYDNVRDFQGHNPVNQEIEATVKDASGSERFVLLNNGVTIVAREANKVGARFRLRDYQIVNGCQTSHILYHNREHLPELAYLPIKLIVTTDAEVTNQVIQGTNRQTEVKLEAFESLAPFQKKLEELYLALGRRKEDPVYYERRSKQYEHLKTGRESIITLGLQINCFLAMFLNDPHSTHRYYGELLSSYRNRLFQAAHSTMPYYVCGAAFTALEKIFALGRLPRSWRRRKYQILMVFRIQNQPFALPFLDKKDIDKYCQGLLDILNVESKCEQAFRNAGELVEVIRDSRPPGRQPPERTKAFTVALENAAGVGDEASATTSKIQGEVRLFSDVKGFGFIVGDDGLKYFVHSSRVVGRGFSSLAVGQRVEFTSLETDRGLQAWNVLVRD